MHRIELLIIQADTAINREQFDTLIDIYADDAVLVIKPGMNAVGKEQIKKAFEAIATHFEHSLDVKQAGMAILETGDTALVLANTVISANKLPATERKAAYVLREAPIIGGFVRLIIRMGTTCLRQMPNHAINSDAQKRRFALLLHAGHGER